MSILDADEIRGRRPGPYEGLPGAGLLLLTLALMLVGLLVGSVLVGVLARVWGYDLAAVLAAAGPDSPLSERNFLRLANLLPHLLAFCVPPLLAVWAIHRQGWLQELGLARGATRQALSYGALWLLVAFPLVQITYWLNKQVYPGGMAREVEAMLQAMMVMESPQELVLTLLVAAVVPAVGEELLFRGVLQRQLTAWLPSPQVAVWLTATLFSAFHGQFDGFVPRLLLGALLGYLFLWSANLWIPIVAHFFFNGLQVVGQYVLGEQADLLAADAAPDTTTWAWAALSLALVLVLGRHIHHKYHQMPRPEGPSHTPL